MALWKASATFKTNNRRFCYCSVQRLTIWCRLYSIFSQSSGNSGFQKRKRDDLNEHDSFCDDSLNNESGSVDEAVDKLVNGEETPKEPASEEDNVLAELSKIYDSRVGGEGCC